jgi:hypothetical protein
LKAIESIQKHANRLAMPKQAEETGLLHYAPCLLFCHFLLLLAITETLRFRNHSSGRFAASPAISSLAQAHTLVA